MAHFRCAENQVEPMQVIEIIRTGHPFDFNAFFSEAATGLAEDRII